MKDSDAILIVFDLSRKSTFEGLADWIELISDSCRQDALVFFIGSKKDLVGPESESPISPASIQKFVETNKINKYLKFLRC